MATLPSSVPPTSWTDRLLPWQGRMQHMPRWKAVTIILSLFATIGWFDYVSGPRLSFALLYFVPITLSVTWIGWRAGCLAAVISTVTRVVGDLSYGPYRYPGASFWNRLVELMVYLVLAWGLHALVSLHRELERRVAERTRALEEAVRARQRLERELLEIATRERNAIGRELHDDLCQQLVGVALAAKVLAEELPAVNEAAAAKARAIVTYVEEGIVKTRHLARGLLLDSIPPNELPNELSNLADSSSSERVDCRFRLEGTPSVDNASVAAQLLRIAQEAIRNALRHGNPREVQIVLGGTADATFLMVQDDGKGFPAELPATHTSLGLQIMEHRAILIGGRLAIISSSQAGTRVVCHLPRQEGAL